MNRATRIAASALGAYAGLLGAEHGVFEILQGSGAPDGILINAVGPPCQAEAVWHACLPALTVVPSFQATGILAIVVGLATLIWAVGFVQRRRGGLVLILLSLAMLPVGGGFVPPLVGIVAGVTGTRVDAPLSRWRKRRPGTVTRSLAALWPWTLVVMAIWLPAGWILGHFFNQAMLRLGLLPFFLLDLGLPPLTALAALAHDVLENGGRSR